MSKYPWSVQPTYFELIEEILEMAHENESNEQLQKLAHHFKPTEKAQQWYIEKNKELNTFDKQADWDTWGSSLSGIQIEARHRWRQTLEDLKEYYHRFYL